MAETITISDELARRIRERVDSGAYDSASDLISAGLNLLGPDFDYDEQIASIRARVEAALADPRRYSAAEVRQHIEERAAQLARDETPKKRSV